MTNATPIRAVRLFLFASLMLGMGMAGAQAQSRPQPELKFPDRICDVSKFGAIGMHNAIQNSVGFDTEAFQKAIDSCAAAGGGTVLVPRNNYFLGPIFLRSNIRLEIAKYAIIAAGTDPALFQTTDKTLVTVTDTGKRPARAVGLINIREAHNVAVTGEGIIDGQGAVWWERQIAIFRADKRFLTDGQLRQTGEGLRPEERLSRPRLVEAANSQNLLFEGITLQNSPSFHLLLQNCDDVTIRRTHILAPVFSFNTDAIDPTDSRNVLIADNELDTGDDLVAIKASGYDPRHPDAVTANITVRDNRMGRGLGVAIGSGTSGGVKHVLVENNTIDGSMWGVRIKTGRGRGGEVSDILVRNNSMKNVETPFAIIGYFGYSPMDPAEAARQAAAINGFSYGWSTYPGDTDAAQPFVANKTPDFHDIVIDGLTAVGADHAGMLIGLPERKIRNLKLNNIHVQANTGLLLRNAVVEARNTRFDVGAGKPVLLQKDGVFNEAVK